MPRIAIDGLGRIAKLVLRWLMEEGPGEPTSRTARSWNSVVFAMAVQGGSGVAKYHAEMFQERGETACLCGRTRRAVALAGFTAAARPASGRVATGPMFRRRTGA